MSKTLYLPLKKEWYEMIESGVKTEEYREIKPYWSKRFLKGFPAFWRMAFNVCMLSREFTILHEREIHPIYSSVRFSYGYTKRTMTFRLVKITVGKGRPEWGAPEEEVFIIKLGERL